MRNQREVLDRLLYDLFNTRMFMATQLVSIIASIFALIFVLTCFEADPDRSNPTRNRFERPLDTIRAFEAAIDGGYNRNSILRSDSESVANWSRRGSYYGSKYPNFFFNSSLLTYTQSHIRNH